MTASPGYSPVAQEAPGVRLLTRLTQLCWWKVQLLYIAESTRGLTLTSELSFTSLAVS